MQIDKARMVKKKEDKGEKTNARAERMKVCTNDYKDDKMKTF